MALENVRIYPKSGQVIEFEAEGFWADRGGEKPAGAGISLLQLEGGANIHLAHIDLAEIAAITKTPVRSEPAPAVGPVLIPQENVWS